MLKGISKSLQQLMYKDILNVPGPKSAGEILIQMFVKLNSD